MNKRIPTFLVLLFCAHLAIAQVDTTIGLTAPGSVTGNYKELTHFLCDDLPGEKQKANAIYNWITHNISYDVKFLVKRSLKGYTTEEKINRALKNRVALCEGYAMLFTAMCREAGLKAVNIDGYAKDWIFDDGDSLYIPRHMWSAVMIDGKWWPVEPTWGAGGLVQSPGIIRKIMNKVLRQKVMYANKLKFKFKYKPGYFMQAPEEFILKHLPTDPLWQLADTTMPLAVFEAGDSAIRKFIELYSKPVQVNPQLDEISMLDELMRVFESADRAYKFNPRYPVVLALKQAYRAESQVIKAFTDSTVQNGLLLINDASAGLRKSELYVKEQKKSFPSEYTRLKKKNTTKNQEAKKCIRQIKTDNKRLVSESKKYSKSATNKGNKLKPKYAAVKKRAQAIDPNKLNKQKPSKIQKKPGSPELREIKDSIAARYKRIDDLKSSIAGKMDTVKTLQDQNMERLDSLGKFLVTADSILVQEAIARINMHDDYDNEVIMLTRLFKELKYHQGDSMQKNYLVAYDTIVAKHERLQKLLNAEMELYKKNLRSMEQYAKWNAVDTSIVADYATTVNDYRACINAYIASLSGYNTFVKGNKKLFTGLGKLSTRQLKISGYMDKVETRRKKLETKTIEENKAFDIKENEKQLASIKTLLDKLQKIADKVTVN
jgi:hypothetical protein